MNALDKLNQKPKVERTALEWAILVCEEQGGEATAMDAAEQLAQLQEANKTLRRAEANYDALQSPMPCGHLARYAVNEKAGTQYCSLCVANVAQAISVNSCPMCETRTHLHQMQNLLDGTPEINSVLYDDAIADLSNQISNVLSLFQCMCNEAQT